MRSNSPGTGARVLGADAPKFLGTQKQRMGLVLDVLRSLEGADLKSNPLEPNGGTQVSEVAA